MIHTDLRLAQQYSRNDEFVDSSSASQQIRSAVKDTFRNKTPASDRATDPSATREHEEFKGEMKKEEGTTSSTGIHACTTGATNSERALGPG